MAAQDNAQEFIEIITPELDTTMFVVAVACGIVAGVFAYYMYQEWQKEHPQPTMIRMLPDEEAQSTSVPAWEA